MKFAQFYTPSTGYVEGSIPPVFRKENVKPIPACGTDGVYSLDGRRSVHSQLAEVEKACVQRGYCGYTIESGSFLKSFIIQEYREVAVCK